MFEILTSHLGFTYTKSQAYSRILRFGIENLGQETGEILFTPNGFKQQEEKWFKNYINVQGRFSQILAPGRLNPQTLIANSKST